MGAMDQNLDNVELKKDLKAAMEVLSEQQKQVIYYRYFEDLTQSKIARYWEFHRCKFPVWKKVRWKKYEIRWQWAVSYKL